MNTNAYVYINTFFTVYILLTNCVLSKYVFIIKVYIIILIDDIYNKLALCETGLVGVSPITKLVTPPGVGFRY